MARKRATEAQAGLPRPVRQATEWFEHTRTIASVSHMQPLVPPTVPAFAPSLPAAAQPTQPIVMKAFHSPPQRATTGGATNRFEGWDDTVFAATRQIVARLRFLLLHTLTNQQKTRIAFDSIFNEFETLFANDTRHFYWEIKHNTFCFTKERANEALQKMRDDWEKVDARKQVELELLRDELKQVDDEREYDELLDTVGELMRYSPEASQSTLATEEVSTPTVEAQLDGPFFGIHSGPDLDLENIDQWLDALIETHPACH